MQWGRDIAVLNVAQSSSLPKVVAGLSSVAASRWNLRNSYFEIKLGGELGVANQLGKRYRCAKCGTEVLCTKAGTGEVICCGEPMKTQEAKPIPSSD